MCQLCFYKLLTWNYLENIICILDTNYMTHEKSKVLKLNNVNKSFKLESIMNFFKLKIIKSVSIFKKL